MVELIGPHGSVTRVSGVEAVRLRRAGWRPVLAAVVDDDPQEEAEADVD